MIWFEIIGMLTVFILSVFGLVFICYLISDESKRKKD